jgi:hypothetical protein
MTSVPFTAATVRKTRGISVQLDRTVLIRDNKTGNPKYICLLDFFLLAISWKLSATNVTHSVG